MLLFYQYQLSFAFNAKTATALYKHDANYFNSAFPNGRAAQNQLFKQS